MDKFQENIACKTDTTGNKNLNSIFSLFQKNKNTCITQRTRKSIHSSVIFKKNLDLYDQSDKNNFRKTMGQLCSEN